MKRFISGSWTLILWLGALGLLAYALAAVFPLNHRYFDIALQFAKPMLVAGVLALIVVAVSRRLGPFVLALAACVLLFFTLRPYGLQDGEVRPGDVRLYVANTWVGNQESERLAASVQSADADIVVLIEIGETTDTHLATILEGYPNRVETPFVRGRSGASRSLIASRWPVREIQGDITDGLPVVAAEVETPSGPLRVFGIHLTRPWPFRVSTGQTWQLERLFTRLGPDPVRTITAGDFNSAPPSRAIRHALRWSGLELISGAPGTWPSWAPEPVRMGIDHVLASPDITPVAARLGEATGSDHRPVIVDFRLGPPEPSLALGVAED